MSSRKPAEIVDTGSHGRSGRPTIQVPRAHAVGGVATLLATLIVAVTTAVQQCNLQIRAESAATRADSAAIAVDSADDRIARLEASLADMRRRLDGVASGLGAQLEAVAATIERERARKRRGDK